jgi:hypothetical protein
MPAEEGIPMRAVVLRTLAVSACLTLVSGSIARSEQSAAPARSQLIEYAAHSGKLQSVLVVQHETTGTRLTSVTRFGDTRLLEEATLDRDHRLVRAQSTLSCAAGADETVILDPRAGVVETHSQAGVKRWSVPSELPWTWVPRACPSSGGVPIATPLVALVTLDGGRSNVQRRLDLSTGESPTITTDQLIVRECGASTWVVVGDEAILVGPRFSVRAGTP